MANKISNFAEGDVNLTAIMQTLNAICKRLNILSLTEFDTSSEPQIAAGSVAECNGAVYYFEENEGISGSPTDGTIYVRLVPSSDSNSDDFVYAEYTNTAPTWSDEKQGWYDSTGNYRYVAQMTLNSGLYDNKILYSPAGMIWTGGASGNLKFRIIEIGDWNMDSTVNVTLYHYIEYNKIRTVNAIIRNDAGTMYFTLPYPTSENNYIDSHFILNYKDSSVLIARRAGGIFDSSSFDSTSYNRGWVTIGYVD